jgi:hypothetical protein
LRAYAQRQTETSEASFSCLQAFIHDLVPVQYGDERLDELVKLRFISEHDVVEGIKSSIIPEPNLASPYPIPEAYIEPTVKRAILYACFSRLIRRSKPVYIALPDSGFDSHVQEVLKAIYLAMPYALRAYSGYITQPQPGSHPDYVSLCFVSTSRRGLYASEPVLTLDPRECQHAIDEIMSRSSSLSRETRVLIDYIGHCDPISRTRLFDEYAMSIEGNGDPESFATMDGEAYGTYHDLMTNWNNRTLVQKDEYALSLGTSKLSPALADIAWRLVSGHLTEERFSYLIHYGIAECKTFDDFTSALLPMLPIVQHVSGLDDTWYQALDEFVTARIDIQNVLPEYEGVVEALYQLFDRDTIDEYAKMLSERHNQRVIEELEIAKMDLLSVPVIELDVFIKDHEKVLDSLVYQDNKRQMSFLITERFVTLFILTCIKDTKYERYASLKNSSMSIRNKLTPSGRKYIDSCWDTYLESRRGYLAAKNNPGQAGMPPDSRDISIEDFLSNKPGRGVDALYAKCLSLEKEGFDGRIVFPASPAFSYEGMSPGGLTRHVSLKQALQVLGPLFEQEGTLQPGQNGFLLLVYLAEKELLKASDYQLILEQRYKRESLLPLTVVAGYACLQMKRQSLPFMGSKRQSPLRLFLSNHQEYSKDIMKNQTSFMATGANEKQEKRLSAIWQRDIGRYKATNKRSDSKTNSLVGTAYTKELASRKGSGEHRLASSRVMLYVLLSVVGILLIIGLIVLAVHGGRDDKSLEAVMIDLWEVLHVSKPF